VKEKAMRLTSLFLSAIAAALVAVGSARAVPLSAGAPAHPAGSLKIIHTIHGCHQTWAPGRQGWHRHGPQCELRKGVTERSRPRGKGKRLGA
jgi:hypothetical protein